MLKWVGHYLLWNVWAQSSNGTLKSNKNKAWPDLKFAFCKSASEVEKTVQK